MKTSILRYAAMLVLMLSALTASAVPAKPGLTKKITLSDGSQIVARLVGDEHGHYWLGQDGNAYKSMDGDIYQRVDAQQVKQRAALRRQAADQRRLRRLAPRKVGEVGSITGQKKGLIILVNFTDVNFQSDNNKALYERIANEENFSDGNFKGSMYDYFKAQSEGQFELTFDIVGPVTVSKNQAYYGSNDSNGNDNYPAKMVIEALQLVNSQVNFGNYDWDGDGEVEQVYVVYAGQGEADGGASSTIWPHEYDLNSAKSYGDGSGAQTLDGVKINTYACGGELNGSNNIAGIGTMCHEFSHCLGYPDFYDTDYSGGQGMFMWDLMDSGSYNDDGYRPAGYTSYERWVAGWKTPITLETTQSVTNMKALQDGGESYIIYNKGNNNEYYLLENRQKTGWDTSLPGAGLLILHVDYSSSVWASNQPNDDPSHQRMTWVAADNQYQYTTYQGTKYYTENGAKNDPFPYGSVNAFNKSTTPAAKFFNKNSDNTYYMDSSVENITQNSNGTISFNFVGISNVATPTFSPAAGRYETAQTVSITCETTGATIYYTLDGTNPTTSSTPYTSPLTISETTTVKALAVKDGEQSAVASAKYTIGAAHSDPNTTTFKLVTSTNDLEPGLRYVIACGSKSMAAGAMGSGTYLSNVSVSITNDILTSTDNVAVFVLEQTEDGWTFQNESTNEYLVCTAAKNVSYSSTASSSTASAWTLSDGTDGVIMTAGSFGTMLYNNGSPRFTTYTSDPTAAMIQANLYMEDSSSTPVTPDPLIVADETLTFSTTVGTPQTKTFEVLSEGLTEDITVTLSGTDSNLFSLGSTTISRTESELGATGSVTFTPTSAGTFSATVTLTSAGADPVTIALTATASAADDPTPSGETLFYEGLTEYDSSGDATNELASDSPHFDYTGWTDLTKVYAGGTNNAYDNGGCLKFGSSKASGSMTTGSISLTGSGTLTFYLKQYGSDTGKLNVTVTGATADVTQFTPSADWTLCIVNLTNATGAVTITLATSSKRAYVDEITLTSGSGTTPVTKEDVTMTFNPSTVTATLGETFTLPTLTTDPTGLTVTYSSSETDVATVDATTGAVTLLAVGTTTITATFAGNENYNEGSASYELTVEEADTPPVVETNRYELVTDASTLAADDKIIIVNADADQALSATQNTNNRAATDDFTVNDDNTLTPGTAVQIITLEKDGTNYFFNVGDGEYLYAASKSSNWLRTTSTVNDNAKATISISSGDATITFQGTNTRNTMRYNPNNNSPIFSCYASTATTGSAPRIYRQVKQVAPTTVTIDELATTAPTAATGVTVMLKRTITAKTSTQNAWNTLCLPFDLTEAQMKAAFGDDVVVKELSSVTTTGGQANLYFTAVNSIQANTPYIMQTQQSGTEYTFENIDVKPSDNLTVEVGGVQFVGNYVKDHVMANDGGEDYYILTDVFKHSTGKTKIKGLRAYFHIPAAASNNIGAIGADFDGDGQATGISEMQNEELRMKNNIYDLQGRLVGEMKNESNSYSSFGGEADNSSLVPGIYIVNGRKVFIR